ncbi:nck-associated protein 5-like isoform X2 [Xiphophorus hellerii]|uniref:nck-associated protein 5-like isoform X2 n=1 Tax=Xiphophorus hellerii TaxID=8084 RepID=UPI0013B41F8E|nr:nck-associated protein 5-like isoform X2 [Xiphophorus hellerii]
MFSAAMNGESTSSSCCLPNPNTPESLGAAELLSGAEPAGTQAAQVSGSVLGRGPMSGRLERREQLKRLSLPEYMDANRCIDELLKQLEEERRNVRREKLAVARLQREVARSKSEGTMREKLIHELEEERRLRLESEKRLREVTEESELGREQMVSLQQQFSRMEETVRSLLQNQTGVLEQSAVDTVDIMKAYKDKLSEEEQKRSDDPAESDAPPVDQEDRTIPLLERLQALEEENSTLALENESQREQYERCLDEVANQVVQALLTQKDLREECLKLRTRVFDLEQQNRALSVLFQQRIKPASDLLLQEVQLCGKPGLPVAKCLSQLSLSVPPPVYPRSSCSSSEISLSSACSEFSSGSYTWNDGRSCGKKSSLTWEKRLSLGSSAPSNICAPSEEQRPTRCKESHILEGLRKLQRRKHRSSSCSSKVSRSGYKDCMNSNEGIYSLGIKNSSKGVSKPSHCGRTFTARGKQFFYDSDDADDELAQSSRRDDIPTKDCWFHCKRLSHSISDSLCSWDGTQEGDAPSGPMVANPCSGCDSKERPEKLVSFISFLSDGEHKSAFSKPTKLHFNPPDPESTKRLRDVDGREEKCSEVRMSCDQPTEQAEREFKRLSRDAAKLLKQKYLGRDQGRTQSADGRPKPLSLMKEPKASKCTQSEESILAIFDAEGEPIELCPQRLPADADQIQGRKIASNCAELVPPERPTRQTSANARNYNVLESPEKPSECESRTSKSANRKEESTERLYLQPTPQRKLIKPPGVRASKGQSIPPLNDAACPKTSGSKIPGRNKPSASPLRVSKGSTAEPSNSGNSGSSTQEKSPSSPTVKMSRFIKTQTSSQSPKAVNSKWSRGPSSTSPHLSRRLLEFGDTSEQPTRDKHCEPSKNKLRSPSPPPPPGRTTSLLIRPNYEGSPQAHKTGVAPPSTLTTGRGPPPSYYTSLAPNMQTTLPIKDKDCLDLDAGYGTALAPQKLIEKTSQHLQKSPIVTQTPTKGTSKRTKDYLPSANSGSVREPDHAPRSSKNVPPPYSALRGSSLQNTFAIKKGPTHENVHQTVQKTSISLPLSLQDSPQCQPEQQNAKAIVSPPASAVMSPSQAEKAAKTRIPMGFKAFLKSPPTSKSSPTVPGKQEKDHINSVSKETVTSNASTQCDGLEAAFSIDLPPKMSSTEGKGKGEVQCCVPEEDVHPAVLPEEADVYEKGKRTSQLFGRSISVTTKTHLKPALGMNGAKARSQSFSANYMEKPNINVLEGPGKVRTQIITNSGERGNSLSRQSSLEVPAVGLAESPLHSPRMRLSHYGGMTVSTSTNGLPDKPSKSGSNREAVTSPTHKEVRSQPTGERTSFNNTRKPKVASHPQFQPQPSFYSPENPAREKESLVASSNEPGKTQLDSPTKPTDTEDKKISPTVCTIEEKVMMGIEENLQKSQEQEKVAASEAKQKTGPSLANWFGLRKSKLPALSGKKSDSPKGKEEKKDLKIGSVLGGKQVKPDKKKDKKKEGPEIQNLSEMNNKLSSIMDHCNNQMGQIASQIQSTTAFIGKDQFVKDLLGRTAVKVSSVTASPPAMSTPRKHGETKADLQICPDTATLIISQKISLKAEEEDGHLADSSCQDHMIGSGCQMRTLDSGIGTFPLPDSVSRAAGRHVPRSQSSPDRVTSDPSQPHVKVLSLPKVQPHPSTSSVAHSTSDPGDRTGQDTQSHLPKPSTSDAIRTKRLSLFAQRSSSSDQDRKRTAEQDSTDGVQMLRTFSGSDTETEPDRTGATVTRRTVSVEQSEDTLKTSLSIMDYYQHEMLSQLDSLDGSARDRISKELSAEKLPVGPSRPASLHISLESLNKLNHCGGGAPDPNLRADGDAGGSSCNGSEPLPSSGFGSRPGLDHSLSDSLYDSFSSCTSQASNGV